MSLEIEKDFELDKTIDNTSELECYGVWVKKGPNDFNEDSIDIENIAEDIIDDNAIDIENISEDMIDDAINIEETVSPEIEINNVETPDDFLANFDLSSFEDGEIDLDAFMDDSTPSSESGITSSSTIESVDISDFGDGEIDLSAFMDGESLDVDSFLGTETKEEKNDIIDDQPIAMDLTFDDDFSDDTIADPSENIDAFDPDAILDNIFTETSSDSFDNFDDMFDNIVDESSNSEPIINENTNSKIEISDVEFDTVSDFDDLLSSFDSDAPSVETTEIKTEPPKQESRDIDITVTMDDEENQYSNDALNEEYDESEIEDIPLFAAIDIDYSNKELDNSKISSYNSVNTDISDEIDALLEDIEEIDEVNINTTDLSEADNSSISDKEEAISTDNVEKELANFTGADFDDIEFIDETEKQEEINEPIIDEQKEDEPKEDETQFFQVDIDEQSIENIENTLNINDNFSENDFFEKDLVVNEPYDEEQENSMDEMSKALLDKIVNEISSLRDEFTSLKNEFNVLKSTEKHVVDESSEEILDTSEENIIDDIVIEEIPESNGGFFTDESDDETIALSGDELNNILNNADFTEEFVDAPAVQEENKEDSIDDIFENIEDDDSLEINENVLSEEETSEDETLEEEITDSVELGDIDEFNDIFDNIEEVAENTETETSDESLGIISDASFDFNVEEDNQIAVEEDNQVELDISEINRIDEIMEDPIPSNEDEIFEIEDLTITVEEDDTPMSSFSTSDEYEEDNLDSENEDSFENNDLIEPDFEDLDLSNISDEGNSEKDIPEDNQNDIFVESSESTLIEDNSENDDAVFDFEEETNEDIDTTLNIDSIFDEDTSFPEENVSDEANSDINEEISLDDDNETSNISLDLDSSDIESFDNDIALELPDDDEDNLEFDDTIDSEIDINDVPENSNYEVDSMNENLRQDVKNVLSYMDQLLENLPEEKIAEFAKSEYFDVYKKLFKDLGLS